jgi:hypothetical protein
VTDCQDGLQRLYDRAYKTLRELQQARKPEEPTPPQNIRIRWVDSKEELDMRAEAHNPSVSEGAKGGAYAIRNEPTCARVKKVNNEARKGG